MSKGQIEGKAATTTDVEKATRERPKREIRVSVDALRKRGPHQIPDSWKRPGFKYRYINSKLDQGHRFANMFERGWDYALDPSGNKITSGEVDILLEMPEDLSKEWTRTRDSLRKEITASRESHTLDQVYKDAGIIQKEFTIKGK